MLVLTLKRPCLSSKGLKDFNWGSVLSKKDSLCIKHNNVFSFFKLIYRNIRSWNFFFHVCILKESVNPCNHSDIFFSKRKNIYKTDQNQFFLYLKVSVLSSFSLYLWLFHQDILLVVAIGLLINITNQDPPTMLIFSIVRRNILWIGGQLDLNDWVYVFNLLF